MTQLYTVDITCCEVVHSFSDIQRMLAALVGEIEML